VVRPWHRNIARATLQAPKVYFYDAGLVLGDDGLRLENLVASHLLKNVQWQQDTRGAAVDLHYIRTKDEAEVDFCLSEGDTLPHLVECKLSDPKPHRALTRFAEQWPEAQASQLLRECKAEAGIGRLYLRAAAPWLAALEVSRHGRPSASASLRRFDPVVPHIGRACLKQGARSSPTGAGAVPLRRPGTGPPAA
jgi:hypothetical protein